MRFVLAFLSNSVFFFFGFFFLSLPVPTEARLFGPTCTGESVELNPTFFCAGNKIL